MPCNTTNAISMPTTNATFAITNTTATIWSLPTPNPIQPNQSKLEWLDAMLPLGLECTIFVILACRATQHPYFYNFSSGICHFCCCSNTGNQKPLHTRCEDKSFRCSYSHYPKFGNNAKKKNAAINRIEEIEMLVCHRQASDKSCQGITSFKKANICKSSEKALRESKTSLRD